MRRKVVAMRIVLPGRQNCRRAGACNGCQDRGNGGLEGFAIHWRRRVAQPKETDPVAWEAEDGDGVPRFLFTHCDQALRRITSGIWMRSAAVSQNQHERRVPGGRRCCDQAATPKRLIIGMRR